VEAGYARHAPALLRKCERLLRSAQDAEDIVHALFVDLLGKETVCPPLPYLYRAVTHRAIDWCRKRSNRQRLLDAFASELEPIDMEHPEQTLLSQRDLLLLCTQLDRKCAETLILRYVDELSLEETATLLGVSTRMVTKRLAKVRRAMQALKHKEGGNDVR